jgi:hypothetical protein
MAGQYLGLIQPSYGRWIWPFKHMEEGDWFTVRHEDRDPESLRNMAMVRGSQLNKSFSVKREHEPGITSVTCVSEDAWRSRAQDNRAKAKPLDFQAMREIGMRCYRTQVDGFKWTGLDVGQSERCDAQMIEKPTNHTIIVTIPDQWTFAVEFDQKGFTLTRVEQGETAESYARAKLEAIMG